MKTQRIPSFTWGAAAAQARRGALWHSLAPAWCRVISTSLTLSIIVGCQANSPESNTTGDTPSTSTILSDQTPSEAAQAKLLAAKDALFTKLSGRLLDAMSTAGPAYAIEVCQVEAGSMAVEVGQEMNVKIGRTGVRLRNTSNVAPAWAAPFIAEKRDTPLFVTLSNKQAAALLPIRLQAQCLMCHGPQEMLAPDIQAKLSQHYPQDQAVGFAEGELRGWFWVESLE
jgi:anti-sigma-K factor RskA